MKKLLSITLLLLTTLTAKAETLEAKSVTELVKKIQSADFDFKERGKIFGYNSIHSCLYVSQDIAIFKKLLLPC